MADLRNLRLNVAVLTGAGTLIAAPGAGKQLVIVDVLASAASTFRQTNVSGTIMAYIPAGSSNMRSGIPIGLNKALFSSAGDVTVTYYIENLSAI